MENLIESDEFCSLPHASQALYFHLNMAADDDGMVGNPGRIIRSLKIAKKYYESLGYKVVQIDLINKPNLVTLIPNILAAKKCPASCTKIKILKSKIIIIIDI